MSKQQFFMPGDRVRIVKCDSDPHLVGKESIVTAVIDSFEAAAFRVSAILKRDLTDIEISAIKRITPVEYFCVLEDIEFLAVILNPEGEIHEREYIYTDHISQNNLRKVEVLSEHSHGWLIQSLRKGTLSPEEF